MLTLTANNGLLMAIAIAIAIACVNGPLEKVKIERILKRHLYSPKCDRSIGAQGEGNSETIGIIQSGKSYNHF
jgi:hypothetical protein